jgi:putative heme iron utilization protein
MGAPEKSTVLPGFMPDRLPEGARPPQDFKPIDVAKELLRTTRSGSLATLDRNTGHPFCSLVNVATDIDNIEIDPRASVLLASTGKGDPLAYPRLTALGAFEKIERGSPEEGRIVRRYSARHPKNMYAGFADFGLWRLKVVSAHLNGGFARAADLKGSDLMTDLADAQEMVEIEESAVEHMNADHADAVRLYATKLLGETDGAWRVTGVDPDGLDLVLGDRIARMPFPARVVSGTALRKVLAEAGAQARAK